MLQKWPKREDSVVTAWLVERLLPPTNEVCEGYVFTGVCLSTGEGCLPLVRGGVSATHTPVRHTPRQTPPLPSACWDTPPAQCMLGIRSHPLPSACWDTASHWNAFLYLECGEWCYVHNKLLAINFSEGRKFLAVLEGHVGNWWNERFTTPWLVFCVLETNMRHWGWESYQTDWPICATARGSNNMGNHRDETSIKPDLSSVLLPCLSLEWMVFMTIHMPLFSFVHLMMQDWETLWQSWQWWICVIRPKQDGKEQSSQIRRKRTV